MKGNTKTFGASSFLITITNCKKLREKDEVIRRLRSHVPAYKSLVIACERHGRGDLHYHLFWDGQKKWTFRKSKWAPIREWLGASNDNYKKWSKNTGITKEEWLVEKWRYCNNLVTAAFAESKGESKGSLWVYNDGDSYQDLQSQEEANLKPDAIILKKFSEGETLAQQYKTADWNQRAYISKNWDALLRMVTNHKKVMKAIDEETPRFTKANFNPIPEAEEVDFSKNVLVLQGESAQGKTQYAKTFFKKPLLVRHPDKLKEFDEYTHDGIIFDDLSYGHWPRESVIHLFDVEEDADINVKNSMVTIPAGVPRIFTTNRKMRVSKMITADLHEHLPDKSFLPAKLDENDNAIDRRMRLVVTSDSLKKIPKKPETPETAQKTFPRVKRGTLNSYFGKRRA